MPILDADKLVAEIVHKGSVASGGGEVKNFANVYHFRRTAQPAAWNSTSIANEFIAAILPAVVAALNADFVTSTISVRCVNDATDAFVDVADTSPGAIAGDRLPDFSAVALILKSALRGASYQGRKHFAPFSESDIGDDVLNAGAVTRVQAIATAILTGFTDADGNSFVPCVLSRSLSTTDTNPTSIVTADVVNILVNKSLGTMRRRKIATVRA